MLRDVSRARPVDHGAGRGDAGAGPAGAGRRADDRPPRRRAGLGAGRGRPRAWCSSTPRPPPTRSSRWPRRRATARGGTSSTGRTSGRWRRRWSGRAEAAGYTALVVTLDTFVMGWRPTDLDAAYLPFLQGVGIANYLTDPAFNAPLGADAADFDKVFRWAGIFGNPSLTWDDLAWLREQTALPIVLKGILHPDDGRGRGRRRGGRHRRVQPRRPPGRRRHRRRSTPCRACSTRSAAPSRSCSTRACAPAPTWSRPSPSGPPRSSTGGPTSTASGLGGQAGRRARAALPARRVGRDDGPRPAAGPWPTWAPTCWPARRPDQSSLV